MVLWDTIETVHNKLRLLPQVLLVFFFPDKKIKGTNNSHLHQNLCAEKEIQMEYQNKIENYFITKAGDRFKCLPYTHTQCHQLANKGGQTRFRS